MPEKDYSKKLRTHAYTSKNRELYDVVFWVMQPAYEGFGFEVKRHEIGHFSYVINIEKSNISETEALMKMMEMERETKRKEPEQLTDEEALAAIRGLSEWKEDFKNIAPFHDKAEAYIRKTVQARLAQQKKPPKLKP